MWVTEQLTVAIDFSGMDENTMEVNGHRQLFGYQYTSKYLLLCSTEETHSGLEQLEGE